MGLASATGPSMTWRHPPVLCVPPLAPSPPRPTAPLDDCHGSRWGPLCVAPHLHALPSAVQPSMDTCSRSPRSL